MISSRGTRILLREVETGDVVRRWVDFHALAFHVAVAPDGKRFLTGDREGGLRSFGL